VQPTIPAPTTMTEGVSFNTKARRDEGNFILNASAA
jgi:hypothetical protein